MALYYRKYLYVTLAVTVLPLIALCFVPGFLNSGAGILGYCVWFVIALILCRFAVKQANREHFRQMELLNTDCNPEAFFAANAKAFAAASRIRQINKAADYNGAIICLNNAVAHHSAGQHDRAIEIAKQLLALETSPEYSAVRIMAYANLAVFLAARGGEGDLDEAGSCLESARAMLKEQENTGAQTAQSAGIVVSDYVLDIARGRNLDSALDYMTKQLDSAGALRSELNMHWYIAEIYRQKGDTARMREHLAVTAEKGAGLNIAELAAQKLAEQQ